MQSSYFLVIKNNSFINNIVALFCRNPRKLFHSKNVHETERGVAYILSSELPGAIFKISSSTGLPE